MELAVRRFARNICSGEELAAIDKLFHRTFPERRDAITKLASAVTESVGVRDLPYTDVPLIRSALYALKEFWREKLLMRAIDGLVRCISRQAHEPRPIASLSRAAFFYDQQLAA